MPLKSISENQDGGVGRHTVPPRTTRTDRESTARGYDTKEIKNKHSSRPVGGAEMGTRVEKTRVAVAGPRLAEYGTNGAGSLSTSRPCSPTFAALHSADKPRGPGSEWWRAGQAECG